MDCKQKVSFLFPFNCTYTYDIGIGILANRWIPSFSPLQCLAVAAPFNTQLYTMFCVIRPDGLGRISSWYLKIMRTSEVTLSMWLYPELNHHLIRNFDVVSQEKSSSLQPTSQRITTINVWSMDQLEIAWGNINHINHNIGWPLLHRSKPWEIDIGTFSSIN